MSDELITIDRQLAAHRTRCKNCYDVEGGKALCREALELIKGYAPRPDECPVCGREQDHPYICALCRAHAAHDAQWLDYQEHGSTIIFGGRRMDS